jgi:hypothetical protein
VPINVCSCFDGNLCWWHLVGIFCFCSWCIVHAMCGLLCSCMCHCYKIPFCLEQNSLRKSSIAKIIEVSLCMGSKTLFPYFLHYGWWPSSSLYHAWVVSPLQFEGFIGVVIIGTIKLNSTYWVVCIMLISGCNTINGVLNLFGVTTNTILWSIRRCE